MEEETIVRVGLFPISLAFLCNGEHNSNLWKKQSRVEHLSHRYSIQWAKKTSTLKLKKGVLGLLGSNGAGKSTTMNIICEY